MPKDLLKRGLNLLLKQQSNILSAAFVIMITIIFSQVLGLVRQRLLVAIFGASNTLGVYLASTRLPDFLFQLLIAGALSSAFIPVFSDYLVKGKEQEGHRVASTLLILSLGIFIIFSVILFIFARQLSALMAPGFLNRTRFNGKLNQNSGVWGNFIYCREFSLGNSTVVQSFFYSRHSGRNV